MKSSSHASFRAFATLALRTLAVGSAATLIACSQRTVTVQLHPLRASGDVSYVCRDSAGNGHSLSECNAGTLARGELNLFALLTQTQTGELAVVNVPLDPAVPQADEGFVDVDPSVPGYGFLHIGARPRGIVSTPGGVASFVGVGEAGKPGIYAIPTSCLGAPRADEPERDLTSWAACSLPVAPGAMAVTIDAPAADGTVAASCDRSLGAESSPPAAAAVGRECPADLTSELVPPGRRKLLVALPDLGSIWVLDAQSLLDRTPGEFRSCSPEAELPLKVELPATAVPQVLPEDLQGCAPASLPLAPPPPTVRATPSGFSLAGDTLYVSDVTAPVVHAIDVGNPCAPRELPPLLPRSLEDRDRVVTTTRVAASPLTPSGKRFVYAIDQDARPTASLMAFDVSPGSTNRTPLVRPGSPYIPFEAPDRIQFVGAVRDVTFVQRDRPAYFSNPPSPDDTGNVEVGVACDPDPSHTGSVGARYRPSADLTAGARSAELRGVFASVLLSSGQLAIVDVEDFDAPCRRPPTTNTSSTPDPFGCANDPPELGGKTLITADGTSTVTGELSCNMVRPHRPRSTYLGITSGTNGVHAPSLASLPALALPSEAAQLMPEERPKLLAVNTPDPNGLPLPAQVYVGTSLFSSAEFANRLELDPKFADKSSLTLPFEEPRAYPTVNDLRLTYEGRVTGVKPGGFLDEVEEDADGNPRIRFHDQTVLYCDEGVQDMELIRDIATTRLAFESERQLAMFALKHTDYVVLSDDFPPVDDAYWAAVVNNPEFEGLTRDSCVAEFGAFDLPQLNRNRDFSIIDAQQQNLLLAPRDLEDRAHQQQARERLRLARFCFPAAVRYFVRAGRQWLLRSSVNGVLHDITSVVEQDANGNRIWNCRLDCSPRKRFFQPRVFEISAKECDYSASDEQGSVCYDACVLDSTREATPHPVRLCYEMRDGKCVDGPEPAAACIHSTATERFALYRGARDSVRDMEFSWETIGGFQFMRLDFSTLSAAVSPQVVRPLPQFNWLSVVDAGALGLAQVSLDSLSTLTPTVN